MPQYVNHERGGHTDKPRREATVAEERRRRSPRRRRHTACGGRRPAARRAVPPGRGPVPSPRSRPVDSAPGPPPRPRGRPEPDGGGRNVVAMSHRKNKTKTTRGSHVLETDGRGLRHPPPARRGMLAHPHRTACPRPRHPGSSDRRSRMLAPHRTFSMSGTAPHSHHMSMCPQGPSHCTRTHTDPSPMTLATHLAHACPPPRVRRDPPLLAPRARAATT